MEKEIVQTKFVGFCVILTEEKYSNENIIGNVSFSQFTKKMIKAKKAYTSDVERENYNGLLTLSKKVVFPLLTLSELRELIDDTYISYESDTMGSLTLEYGWLNAKSFEYHDDYNNQTTNAYISVIWEFENYTEEDKDTTAMKLNYSFQEKNEEIIFELLNKEDFDELENLQDSGSLIFQYDKRQLELKF